MISNKELEELARQLRNEKARHWRFINKEKVREINRRYWLNKAKQKLAKKYGESDES